MATTLDDRVRHDRTALDGPTVLALAGAAVAFNLGGALHPGDDGHGTKVAQLHQMLTQGAWWPSHVGLLVSFALFSVVFLRLARRSDLPGRAARVVQVMAPVSVLTTLAMVPHLLAPLGADSIADGRANAVSAFMTVDETLADAPWAIGVAVLAVVAGLSGVLGNRLTALVGLVGGLAFAAAAVTIPFSDTLDVLFAVGGTGITFWALSVAAIGWTRSRRGAAA